MAAVHVNPVTVNPCGALSCVQGRPASQWRVFVSMSRLSRLPKPHPDITVLFKEYNDDDSIIERHNWWEREKSKAVD